MRFNEIGALLQSCLQSAAIAVVLLTTIAWGDTAKPLPSKLIHLEAENARLSGPVVATERTGYTGTGYVTGFNSGSDKMTLTLPDARAGLYDVQIRYSAPLTKGYDLVVNGATYSGMFPPSPQTFTSHDAGNVELQPGSNTVEIRYGWGHYDIDSIDFVPAVIPPLAKVPAAPVDPHATAEVRVLKAYLVRHYGTATLSGQYGSGDSDYVQRTTGILPAIRGGDFMDYSPSRLSHGADPKTGTEDMIAAAKAGQVITMLWHWNAPTDLIDKMEIDAQGQPVNHLWYKGFYADATTFDVQKALADPDSADYKLLLRDMDAIAIQLQKFSDAGVPVLWRPLHEAEGTWFWWGAKGPDPFKQLWRLMYDRFTNYHHLHNLIWVYSSGTDPAWYPGDRYVDVVGVDQYPSDVSDPQDSVWKVLQSEYGGRKLLAITEFGGVPDVTRMQRLGARWSYFVSWTDTLGPKKLSLDALKKIYTAPGVVTAPTLPPAVRLTK